MQITFIDGTNINLTKDSSYLDAKWCISFKFNTDKERQAFVGLFPKYCKITTHSCGGLNPKDHYDFGVKCDLSIPTNKVTGEFNETAEKRVKKIKSILASI